MSFRFRAPARLLLAGIAVACSGDSSGPPLTVAAVAVVSGSNQSGIVDASLAQPLVVRVTDTRGSAMAGVPVTFRVAGGNGSIVPATAATDASGQAQTAWRLGTSTSGEQRVEAQTMGTTIVATFTATAQPGPATTLLKVTNEQCAIPGANGARDVIVRVTDTYGNPVAQSQVGWTVNGSGNISQNSSSTGADGRASTRWAAGAEPSQSLTAAVAGLTPTVFTIGLPTSRTIAQGETLTLTGNSARCNDVNAGGARYLVAVTNTLGDAGLFSSLAVRGALASSSAMVMEPDAAHQTVSRVQGRRALSPQAVEARRSAAAHQRVLDANIEVIRRMQRLPAANRVQHLAMAVSAPPPNVGDTLSMRVPNVASLSCNLSSVKGTIRARVVYAGTHGVVFEDVAAPLAGTMDDLYRQVGQEFDDVMWPILAANFGDPLAFDAQTDGNERMFMVFTPQVNQMDGIAGFVVSTDFYPAERCPLSNRAEIFYARAPESSTPGFDSFTKDNWLRQTRTVVIHEGKHLVAFAHRFARSNGDPPASSFEQAWLEEASAMTAEELWARSVYGYAQRGNVNYRNSVYCEVRPAGFPECGPITLPRAMYDHFLLLHDYQAGIERLSPIGAARSDDFTWYGSGWAFLRWAIDHSAVSESAFLTALTQEPSFRGTANLESRTGRSFADLITDWTLTLALDDRAGFTPPRTQLDMPSWNMQDIFRGLAQDFSTQCGGPCFQANPLALRLVSFGNFTANIDQLQGGSMAILEVSGAQAGRQLLEITGPGGAALASGLRVTIVRLQ